MAGNTQYYNISYPTSTDYVKDGASAIQTVATGFDSAVAIPTYNAQTGTTYTFALTDVGKTVTASNASAQTYTIPPTASVAWAANTTLIVTNLGAGVVTFAAGAGVTVTNAANTLAQYQSARLVRTGLNAWTVTPASGSSAIPALTLISTTTIGTTVSSVTVSSAFSATYDNYKILISGGVASANDMGSIQLGATTSGYYYQLVGGDYNNTPFASGTTTGSLVYAFTHSTNGLNGEIEIRSPFLSKISLISAAVSQGFSRGLFSIGALNNTTSYTAFTLAPASGTLTGGTIRVYGYNS